MTRRLIGGLLGLYIAAALIGRLLEATGRVRADVPTAAGARSRC
jgi:hypothetical protein